MGNQVALPDIGILFVALFSIIMAHLFECNIKSVWKTLGSISSSALLMPVLIGHLAKFKIRDNVFIMSASLGAIVTVFWRMSGLKEKYQIDEIYLGMLFSTIPIFLDYSKSKLLN